MVLGQYALEQPAAVETSLNERRAKAVRDLLGVTEKENPDQEWLRIAAWWLCAQGAFLLGVDTDSASGKLVVIESFVPEGTHKLSYLAEEMLPWTPYFECVLEEECYEDNDLHDELRDLGIHRALGVADEGKSRIALFCNPVDPNSGKAGTAWSTHHRNVAAEIAAIGFPPERRETHKGVVELIDIEGVVVMLNVNGACERRLFSSYLFKNGLGYEGAPVIIEVTQSSRCIKLSVRHDPDSTEDQWLLHPSKLDRPTDKQFKKKLARDD